MILTRMHSCDSIKTRGQGALCVTVAEPINLAFLATRRMLGCCMAEARLEGLSGFLLVNAAGSADIENADSAHISVDMPTCGR